MFYYIMYEGKTPSGFIQSHVPRSVPSTVQVSESEFVSRGGVLLENPPSQLSLLEEKVKAQSERSDFLEDCIAEMAEQVYGGV